MEKFKSIVLRLSENNHNILCDLKKQTKLSINNLMNIIISKQNRTNYIDDCRDFNEENKTIRIKISSSEYNFLKKQAEQDGLNHINTEVKYRLLNTIYKNKYFTNIELTNFIKTRAELNIIGRNINQLLKLIHTKSTLSVDEEVFKNMLNDINNNIKTLSTNLNDIVENSKNRY